MAPSAMERVSNWFSQVGSRITPSVGGGVGVGLSIGTSSIKLVEVKKGKRETTITNFGIGQLPEDAIMNREIANPVAVTEVLKDLVAQMKPSSKVVCTSLSGSSLIIKRMTVEVNKPSELQAQVFWEAEQYLPFEASEVVMDFQLLSPIQDKRADVLLVAAKLSVLDAYTQVIEAAGLQPKFVDVDFFAMSNLFEASYPANVGEAVAICDFGASATKTVVVHDGIPVFTKDSVLGGLNLTKEIQKHLNLSYVDAEALKTGGQQGLPQEVSELMHIMAENFASEVKRALDFYNASTNTAPVSQLLICGGSARIPQLLQTIEERVNLPTQFLNPFNSISYDPKHLPPEYVQSIGPLAAVPLGLALRAAAK